MSTGVSPVSIWRVPRMLGGPLLLLMGFGLGLLGCLDVRNWLTSGSWPTAKAYIEASEVEKWTGRGATTYVPAVEYSYRVDGVEYRGTRIAFGRTFEKIGGKGNDSGMVQAGAEAVLAPFPKGREVDLHYLPSDPKLAVLTDRLSIYVLNSLAIGLGFLWMGLRLFLPSLLSNERLAKTRMSMFKPTLVSADAVVLFVTLALFGVAHFGSSFIL